MTPDRKRQRGEGKIGCVVSILLLALFLAAGSKLVPYWWAVDQLKDGAEELASRAGNINDETIKLQLKAKAKELDLPEAMAASAITITRVGSTMEGSLTVALRFKREIDFYGFYKFTWVTEKQVTRPYMDSR